MYVNELRNFDVRVACIPFSGFGGPMVPSGWITPNGESAVIGRDQSLSRAPPGTRTRTHARTHARTHTYTRMYVWHMCVYVCMCMYVSMYLCMYVCMHTCTHIHTRARARARTHINIHVSPVLVLTKCGSGSSARSRIGASTPFWLLLKSKLG